MFKLIIVYNKKLFSVKCFPLETNILFCFFKLTVDVYRWKRWEKLGFCNLDSILYDLFLNGDNIQNGYVTERDFNRRCFELYSIKTERALLLP